MPMLTLPSRSTFVPSGPRPQVRRHPDNNSVLNQVLMALRSDRSRFVSASDYGEELVMAARTALATACPVTSPWLEM